MNKKICNPNGNPIWTQKSTCFNRQREFTRVEATKIQIWGPKKILTHRNFKRLKSPSYLYIYYKFTGSPLIRENDKIQFCRLSVTFCLIHYIFSSGDSTLLLPRHYMVSFPDAGEGEIKVIVSDLRWGFDAAAEEAGFSIVWKKLSGFLKMDNVIGGKFKLGRKIGGGSFGELFLGKWDCLWMIDWLRLDWIWLLNKYYQV